MKFSSSSQGLDVKRSLCLRGLSEYPQSGRSGGRWNSDKCQIGIISS